MHVLKTTLYLIVTKERKIIYHSNLSSLDAYSCFSLMRYHEANISVNHIINGAVRPLQYAIPQSCGHFLLLPLNKGFHARAIHKQMLWQQSCVVEIGNIVFKTTQKVLLKLSRCHLSVVAIVKRTDSANSSMKNDNESPARVSRDALLHKPVAKSTLPLRIAL